ncbi:MAG: inner membrane [Prolixibacteraceae bacterium]|nr:MAG: inner membrane [Prolixibacteraceae bacterium]
MALSVLIIVAGFVLLIKGAGWLVTGASELAKKHNVSDLVIGLTIVSFGTSAPELVVNTVASINQHSDIVFGNIIGSNVVNLFLILGLAGLIYPITVHSNTVWREIPISALAVVVLFVLSNGFLMSGANVLSRIDGAILLAFFAGFLYYIYIQLKTDRLGSGEENLIQMTNLKIWVLIVIGLAGLVAGGKLVVDNAVKIATFLGVSQKIIGLTIVAIGTSLPELMTSVVAALKKNSDIAIGNVIGSNIFNILFILSVSSLINPVQFNTSFNSELYLLAGGTMVLFIAMFTSGRRKLDRWEGAVLLGIYLLYTGWLIAGEF